MSTNDHRFGGAWTETKLEILEKYLKAWLRIFHSNEKARFYKTVYVDAFAGTGYRNSADGTADHDLLAEEATEIEEEFLAGSVSRVLNLQPGFDRYNFVDLKKQHAACLDQFSQDQRVNIVRDDANHFISDWVNSEDWQKTRAVVFLDPYGMQVDWSTLEAIAATESIDLWLLFPLGGGVNRMLTRGCLPSEPWQQKLSNFFGTDEWKTEFYETAEEDTLFGKVSVTQKVADFDAIKRFFIKRLRTIFPGVADNPARLCNSKNNPMYLFCFASANPSKFDTAIKIAQDILKKI